MPFAAAYKITAWNQENQKINIAKEKVFAGLLKLPLFYCNKRIVIVNAHTSFVIVNAHCSQKERAFTFTIVNV